MSGEVGKRRLRLERPRDLFAQVPRWLVEEVNISDVGLRVWCALWLLSDFQSGQAEVTIGQIGKLIHRAPSTVYKGLEALMVAGAVEREQRFDEIVGQRPSVYRLRRSPSEVSETPPRELGGAPPESATPINQNVVDLMGPVDREGGKASPEGANAKKPRPRDLLFEMLYEFETGEPYGSGTSIAAGQRGRLMLAAKGIREAEGPRFGRDGEAGGDGPVLAAVLVEARRQGWEHASAKAVEAHWTRLRKDAERRREATERAAASWDKFWPKEG